MDVEWKADRRGLPPAGATRIVLSHHDFSGMPGDLAERVCAMHAEQPATVKVAATATRLTDCLTLREAMSRSTSHVAIAMGSAGQLSRV